ncbi:E3 ubiquitin-protein ligase SGR9, amyloplastic [Diospyros lotus]|uniref:E3 ubiquitin-protein ligase SGR9, amyloplastic n=1 Tax=Diospyros lotus TaxID=55363 RepID=UPI002259F313|nr:E3 ubiquitin-protein ligase SGR9, amyloplastic [Diospyros lotus]
MVYPIHPMMAEVEEVGQQYYPSSTESTLMAALSTLSPSQLSDLTLSISEFFRLQRRRISAVLSSPPLFSLTLHHLLSLSLPHKSLLIARHLLFALSLLARPLSATPPLPAAKLRDLDSALLLLLLSELHHHFPHALQAPPSKWPLLLSNYLISHTMLALSTFSTSNSAVLVQYVDVVAKGMTFVGGGKEGREVAAAAAAAVVALPSAEVSGVGRVEEYCVICKEEMREGRDVCKLPCDHLFHWMCILPWLKNRNTCPCCRYQLPTDDVFGEIHRLWEVVVNAAGGRKFSSGR